MYSLVALLTLIATTCFPRAFALGADAAGAAPWLAGFALSLAVAALHAQLGAVLRDARARRPGSCCTCSPRRRGGATLLRDGLLGFGGALAALPAVGADPALPGRPHRRAVVRAADFAALLDVPGDLLGYDRRRSCCCWPPARA